MRKLISPLLYIRGICLPFIHLAKKLHYLFQPLQKQGTGNHRNYSPSYFNFQIQKGIASAVRVIVSIFDSSTLASRYQQLHVNVPDAAKKSRLNVLLSENELPIFINSSLGIQAKIYCHQTFYECRNCYNHEK